MNNIQYEKSKIRALIRQKTLQSTSEQKEDESKRICKIILESSEWKDAKTILLFGPLKDEPDISSLLSISLAYKKKLFLPQFNPLLQTYQIAPVYCLKNDLLAGKYGILEPNTKSTEIKSIDMIFVPGLGFGLDGSRLGRGKGFYDRLLPLLSGTIYGVCWSWAIFHSVPSETHDFQVNILINPHTGYQYV